MDIFNIPDTLNKVMEIFFLSRRNLGKSAFLVNYIKDGDRVIFSDYRLADRFESICRKEGKKVIVSVIPIEELDRFYSLEVIDGNTYFDHHWTEKFYLHSLENTTKHFLEICTKVNKKKSHVCVDPFPVIYTPPRR